MINILIEGVATILRDNLHPKDVINEIVTDVDADTFRVRMIHYSSKTFSGNVQDATAEIGLTYFAETEWDAQAMVPTLDELFLPYFYVPGAYLAPVAPPDVSLIDTDLHYIITVNFRHEHTHKINGIAHDQRDTNIGNATGEVVPKMEKLEVKKWQISSRK